VDEVEFGRYRLISLIGHGGMGKVWRAYDTVMRRDVAIKVLRPELAAEPGYRERFEREAFTAARLTEQHVIPIFDAGEIDGQLYLVMPNIDSVDLQSLLDRDGPMTPEQAVRVVEQLAGALDAAHAAGLVHRDVKPSNALITDSGNVYLIDFGIVHDESAPKLTRTGWTIGTDEYMAPERYQTGTADARADIYALAGVLHACLTGNQPFPGGSGPRQMHAHIYLDPPSPSGQRPEVPRGFDDVIARGMAKNPDERYQTASDLATAARLALTVSEGADTVQAPPARRTPLAAAPNASRSAADGDTRLAPPVRKPQGKATRARPAAKPDDPTIKPTKAREPRQPRRDIEEPPTTQSSQPRHRRLDRRAQIGIGVGAAVVVIAAGVWTERLVSGSSSPVIPAPESSARSTPATAETATALGIPLPPFSPPAGLGANCVYTPTPNQPAAKTVTPPRPGKVPTDPANISITITTNQGQIGVQLDNGKAPCTVNNFVSLAQKGYFDGTHCHRLTTGPSLFVLQCGDPKGDGTGGPGYQFADEYPSNQYPPDDSARTQPVVYPRGAMAMANAGPGTNGSQFFIVYKDSLVPPDYTVFGKVDDNDMAVIDKIAAVGTVDGTADGKPKIDVVITSARLD
jgi:serine/threonine protein kinase/cyclophilin family peptidyl-prolyl cis-trans isomerase